MMSENKLLCKYPVPVTITGEDSRSKKVSQIDASATEQGGQGFIEKQYSQRLMQNQDLWETEMNQDIKNYEGSDAKIEEF